MLNLYDSRISFGTLKAYDYGAKFIKICETDYTNVKCTTINVQNTMKCCQDELVEIEKFRFIIDRIINYQDLSINVSEDTITADKWVDTLISTADFNPDDTSDISLNSHESEIDPWTDLKQFRSVHFKNLLIGALNINSLRNKFECLKPVLLNGFIDVFSVMESKLDNSFPVSQFAVKGFHVYRQDSSATSGGIITWIRSDLACNRRHDIDMNNEHIQSICIEIHINKEKWFILSVYRLPDRCINGFMEKLSVIIDKILKESLMLVIIGDMNIDISKCNSKVDKLNDILNLYNLCNKITEPTCFKSSFPTVIDLCIVSKPTRFTAVYNKNCGLSDWHNLIVISSKLNVPKIKSKVLHYRSFKKFDEQNFKRDISYIPFQVLDIFDDVNDKYWMYSYLISDIINEHAPLKKKFIKGNNAPYMNSKLKHIMYRKRMSQNNYWKHKGNKKLWEIYRKNRNEFVKVSKHSRQEYFRTRCQNGAKDKTFWQTIKPYITDKVTVDSDIMLKEGNNIVTSNNDVANIFNEYFKSITDDIGFNDLADDGTVDDILQKYNSHPSMKLIKENCNTDEVALVSLSVAQVCKLLTKVNPRKATGYDSCPPRLLHLARDELAPSMTVIINNIIETAQFPNDLKLAEISPCFKKGNKLDKTKYRPVSILPAISKIVESAVDMQLSEQFYDKKAGCLSAYRKMHNTQSVLLKAVEDWKNALDKDKYCGAILMDLSKAFDVIPHGLLLAKLHVYGFDRHCIDLIANYLKDRYQRTKICRARSEWVIIRKGIPQGSILGPTLFNIFINDMLISVKDYNVYNYADDNTVSYECDSSIELARILETCGDTMTEWFTNNGMQANPDKYQAIVFGNKTELPKCFSVKGKEVKCIDHVRLLGVEIDRGLKFDLHISDICKKASRQINAIMRLCYTLDTDVKEKIYSAFIKSTFSYCPVVWMFSSKGNIKKLERLQCRALKFVYCDFDSSYSELLQRNNEMSVHSYLEYALCIEVYKCLNNLNPDYLCSLFERKPQTYNMRDNYKIVQKKFNKIFSGYHSFTYYGAKIWNGLPIKLKSIETINDFKKQLKAFIVDRQTS